MSCKMTVLLSPARHPCPKEAFHPQSRRNKLLCLRLYQMKQCMLAKKTQTMNTVSIPSIPSRPHTTKRERRHLTFLYFFIFIYISEFKCDDPENGVNKQTSLSDVEQQQLEQQETDMDGGYGWLVILGTFMVQVTSFGTASCW